MTLNRGAILGAMTLVVLAATLANVHAQRGVAYELIIDCPSTTNGQCPIEAWDLEDALGDPAIAVDPDDVENMIIASLHGTGSDMGGPTPKSRPGQSFTTHTSTNHGAYWTDKPYTPPDEIPSSAYGEHPSIALDPYGHVFIGSLYSIPTGGREGPRSFDYVLAAQKFDNLQDIERNQDGDYRTQYLGSVYAGNRISETWFLHNPVTDNMTVVWTEQITSYSGTASAEGRISQNLANVIGHPTLTTAGAAGLADAQSRLTAEASAPASARASDPANAPTPETAMSVIGIRWTDARSDSPYQAQPLSWAIGPCSTSTNPVLSEGWLYIGCKVAAGEGPLRWDAKASPGDIAMFRMHPDGGEPQYLGLAPVSGGLPKLGVRSDGRMAIMTTEVVQLPQGPRIRLDGSYGQYDPGARSVAWGDVHNYGRDLQILFANAPFLHTSIQDMIYREYSGVIHLILKRVVDSSDDELAYRPRFFKAIVAIDEVHGVLDEIDLGIGALVNRMKDYNLFTMPEGRFNDTSDDFLELPPGPFRYQGRPLGDSYQREFYAVGNYGLIDFAEIVEITELRGPAFPPLPNPPPPPTPAPAASGTLALGMAGALTASSIIAGVAFTTKRKSVTRAGKK